MVGELIALRRRARGLSQTELGRRTGTSQRQVSRLENGEDRTLPRRDTLDKFGTVLGIALAEFYQAAGVIEGLPQSQIAETPATYDVPPPSLFTLVDQLDEVRVIRLDQLVSAGPGEAVPQGIEYRARIKGRKGRTPLYSVTAVGTCMTPDIRPGDEVLFDADRMAEPGHTVVAVIDHEDAVVKRLVEHDGKRYLSSLDGEHLIPVDERVRVVGVVVLSQHRFL